MKIYQGTRTNSSSVVTVKDGDYSSKLDPRFDLRNHSPTGFEWGYGGSGPAQLALAILADFSHNDQFALGNYQDFKFKVIGQIQGDEWTLTSEAIVSAMQELKEGGPTNG